MKSEDKKLLLIAGLIGVGALGVAIYFLTRRPPAIAPAVVLEDFESIANWTIESNAGATPTIQNTTAILGNALKVKMAGFGANAKWIANKDFSTTNFFIYVRANNTTDQWALACRDNTLAYLTRFVKFRGIPMRLAFYDGNGGPYDFNGTFAANTWYRFEIEKYDDTHFNIYWKTQDGTLIDGYSNRPTIRGRSWTDPINIQLHHDDQDGIATEIYWDELTKLK